MKSISFQSLAQHTLDKQIAIVDMRHMRAQNKVSFASTIPFVLTLTKQEIKRCATSSILHKVIDSHCHRLIKQLNRRGIKKVLLISECGGLRQKTLATYLESLSIEVTVIEGGMDSILKEIRNYNYKIPHLKVFIGFTGAGKSARLLEYEQLGEQVICLHRMAMHRGSVFGELGTQPTNEQFQLDLYLLVQQFDMNRPVFVEWEPDHLGAVSIPQGFRRCYSEAELCWLDVPFEERVDRLITEYSYLPSEILLEKFQSIAMRFSHAEQERVTQSIMERNFKLLLKILVPYFDGAYRVMYDNSKVSIPASIHAGINPTPL